MELRLPAPCLVVLIGPSGSGKTTWAREHFAENEVVSSDSLRATVGIDEDDQRAGTAAFDLLDLVVAERTRRNLTTVVDTTGLDEANRRRWVDTAHAAGLPAHAVLFDTPPEVCHERNGARPRPIPKGALDRQIARFRRVSRSIESEGFDGVHRPAPVAALSPVMIEATEPVDSIEPARGHRFGLLVSRFDWGGRPLGETLREVARRAEAAGFSDLWVMDHFRQIRSVGRPWEDMPEAYTTLSFLAGLTEEIDLGVLVSGITHRHPVLLGKMVATLDAVSGGRAMCGLGVAWDSQEHLAYGIDFPDTPERYELLEETVQMLPLLWGPGSPPFEGRLIQARELACYPRPVRERIPILIGGSGENKTLRLVARYADICNLFGDPATIRRKVEILNGHCEEIGRDPGQISVSHLSNVLVAASRGDLRARIDQLRDRNTSPEEYSRRNKAGTIEDHISLFTSYAAAGASHSIVSMPDVHLEGSIEAFGRIIEELGRP